MFILRATTTKQIEFHWWTCTRPTLPYFFRSAMLHIDNELSPVTSLQLPTTRAFLELQVYSAREERGALVPVYGPVARK